jgi:hypothetical protein
VNLERAPFGGEKLRIPSLLFVEKMRTQSRFNVRFAQCFGDSMRVSFDVFAIRCEIRAMLWRFNASFIRCFRDSMRDSRNALAIQCSLAQCFGDSI